MKKKYNTLNEEVNRIKTLFTEERLYGNIVDKSPIIVEQWKRKLIKALSPASAALKGLDTKRITRFTTDYFDVKSFEDALKHLDEFPTIWGKIIKDAEKIESAKNALKYLEDVKSGKHSRYKTLKEIPDDSWDKLTQSVTREGGLRDQFYDLMDNARGSKSTIGVEDIEGLVLKNKNGVHTIHIKNKNTGETTHYKLGGEEPKVIKVSVNNQYAIDAELKRINKKKVEAEKNRVELEKKEYKDSESSLDSDLNTRETGGGESSSSTTYVPPKSTDDEIQEAVLDVIDEAVIKTKGKGVKGITLKQLKAHAKGENNIILFRDKDGNLHEVSLYKEWVPITKLDPKTGEYMVTDFKLVKQEVIGEPKTNKPWFKSKKSKTRSMSLTKKDIGSWLRYLFPQSSWVLNKVNWIPSRNIIKLTPKIKQKPRMSFWGSSGGEKATDVLSRGTMNTIELPIRLLGEQFILVTLVGNYYHLRRGDDLSLNPLTNLPNWVNHNLFKTQPINMLLWGIMEMIQNTEVWDGLREECKIGCEEKGIAIEDVLESSCYKKCEEKVTKLQNSYDDALDVVQDWAAIVSSIEDLENYGPKRRKKWCEEGEKQEMVSTLLKTKQGLEGMKKKYDGFVKDNPKSATLIKFMSDMFPNLSEGIFGKGEDSVKISTINEKIKEVNKYCDDIENGEYENILPGNAEENGIEVKGTKKEKYDHSTNLEASLEIKATATPIKLIS